MEILGTFLSIIVVIGLILLLFLSSQIQEVGTAVRAGTSFITAIIFLIDAFRFHWLFALGAAFFIWAGIFIIRDKD